VVRRMAVRGPAVVVVLACLLCAACAETWTCQLFNSSSDFCGELTPERVCYPEGMVPEGGMKSRAMFEYKNNQTLHCPLHADDVPSIDKETFCTHHACQNDSDCNTPQLQCFISCMYCRKSKSHCILLSDLGRVAPKEQRSGCFCYGSECDVWTPLKTTLLVICSVFGLVAIVLSIYKYRAYQAKHKQKDNFIELAPET